jgi:hypothetical protein
VHQIMLVVYGIHLLENLRLDEVAAQGAQEFALMVQPLKLVGATGSTVAPVAYPVRILAQAEACALLRMNDQLSLHFCMGTAIREIAVETESARAIGAKLERGRSARGNAPDDAVFVDGEAVGDVLAVGGDPDEVVLCDFDAVG